ncbi:AAA family ATPase [Streptomyces europaeiscabiei]|uniref:AAA family ATPase n=1 Tax=Streptomyces europaeiscabiei TaxID=146819 RepID=UPI0029A700E7|nr:AAA family ATPase [Streptomyces europaeiscabiei]MDX3634809.1 AAA family ATPase [Streptomyces europaeiscabiei]MDX3652765.1 AAA family ATPase [Streptomyces europaeiscabiei]
MSSDARAVPDRAEPLPFERLIAQTSGEMPRMGNVVTLPPQRGAGAPAEISGPVLEPEVASSVSRFVQGGSFLLNVPSEVPAVWGKGGEVLWAEGEALIIAAPQGVGKTTIACQCVRGRLGLQDSVLGLPVTPGKKKVLYLAMDRPRQFQRAANRIFAGDDEAYLDEHLVIWPGPPPYDFAKQTDILAAMCERAGADTVVIDSIKDAAIGLSNDEVGAGYNRARQKAIAEGIEVLELHHNRKEGSGGGEPNTLADVYGSTWITSGAGSVIFLWGEAGDPVVKFKHLKQPMEPVGPFMVLHDHAIGVSSVQGQVDLLALLRASGPGGVTPLDAAREIFETGAKRPTDAEREKARRKLEKLVNEGMATSQKQSGAGQATRYYSVEVTS